MSDKLELLCVSDVEAAFIVPTLMWLLGMPIQRPDDEDWSIEVVDRNVLTRGEAVCLVMHEGDYRDGALHCGPRVSQAIKTASKCGKVWFFLMPLQAHFAITSSKRLSIQLNDGTVVEGLDTDLATSDLRFALAIIAAHTPTDTTPSS